MTDEATSPLRRRMIEDMTTRHDRGGARQHHKPADQFHRLSTSRQIARR
ncbi:hypothetical protein [Bradyrhizobium cenepequi]